MYLNKIGITFLFLVTLIISMGCVSAENVNVSDTQVSDINVNSVEQSSSSINEGVYDSSPANPAGYDSNSTGSNAVGGNGVYDDVSNSVDSSYSSADGNSVVTDADVSSNKIGDHVSTSINSNYFVNPSMTLNDIQILINSSTTGSVFFSAGNYYNMSLHAKSNVNLIGQNAVLYGDGHNYIINISNINNVLIKGFTLKINSNASNGFSGFNVTNCRILNNKFFNGGDAINIFKYYSEVKIINNFINNMTGKWGDGISLVCHNQTINMDTWKNSIISNNTIYNTKFGIFIGGNFKGLMSKNHIIGSNEGMHFQGKGSPNNGKLRVELYGNTIKSVIAMELDHPNVEKLRMRNNFVQGTFRGVNTNNYFGYLLNRDILVKNNSFYNGISDAFKYSATNNIAGENRFY